MLIDKKSQDGMHLVFGSETDPHNRSNVGVKMITVNRGDAIEKSQGTLPWGFHLLCDPITHKEQLKNLFKLTDDMIRDIDECAGGNYIYMSDLPRDVKIGISKAFDEELTMRKPVNESRCQP